MKRFIDLKPEDVENFKTASTLELLDNKYAIIFNDSIKIFDHSNIYSKVILNIKRNLKSGTIIFGNILHNEVSEFTDINMIDINDKSCFDEKEKDEILSTIKEELYQIELKRNCKGYEIEYFTDILNIIFTVNELLEQRLKFAIVDNNLYVDEQAYFLKLWSECNGGKIIENNYAWVGSISGSGIQDKTLNELNVRFNYVNSHIHECKIKKLNITVDNSSYHLGLCIFNNRIKEMNIIVKGTRLCASLNRNTIDKINIDFTKVNKYSLEHIMMNWELLDKPSIVTASYIGEINIIINEDIYYKLSKLHKRLNRISLMSGIEDKEQVDEYIVRVMFSFSNSIYDDVKRNLVIVKEEKQ